MGERLCKHFAWHGTTSRDEYRRWLALIITVDLVLLWATYKFGEDGTVNLAKHGWIGVPLFLVAMLYYVGWLSLTARRLRSADISRAWLLLAFFSINLSIDGFYINFTIIAAIVLTAVATVAADHDRVCAA